MIISDAMTITDEEVDGRMAGDAAQSSTFNSHDRKVNLI